MAHSFPKPGGHIMRRQLRIVPGIITMFLFSFQGIASAMTVTADFDGECGQLSQVIGGGQTALQLTGRDGNPGSAFICGHYKIVQLDAGQGEARIEPGPDGNNDTLYLRNALFTKTSATTFD